MTVASLARPKSFPGVLAETGINSAAGDGDLRFLLLHLSGHPEAGGLELGLQRYPSAQSRRPPPRSSSPRRRQRRR